MPANFGSVDKLGIVVPALSDNANIVNALSQLFYGYKSDGTTLINGADPNLNLDDVYAAKYSIAGYIRKLQVDKVNKAGNMTQFESTTTPAELRGLISGTSGTGNLLFASTPIITSPTINTSLILSGSTSGNITLTAPAVSGTTAISFPATSGTLVTTGDTGTVTSAMILNDTIVNADVNSNAAIAYSKLNLSGSIVNADISTSASIAISKLAASTISGKSLGTNLDALTIGTGLSGTSYNGSSPVTIAIDSTVATLTGTQTLTNKSISGTTNTFSNIPNSATSATDANTASAIVARDANKNFSAGTITANLNGTATSATNLVGPTGTLGLGRIPYQTDTGTAYVAPGSDLYLLQLKGNVPTWVNYSSSGTIKNATIAATASSSVVAADTTTSSSVYPIFVTSATSTISVDGDPVGLTLKTTSDKFSFIPSTGVLSATGFSGTTFNGLSLTAQPTGFTISGGTTSKTLTVGNTASVSGTNTGDQTISLTGDVTGSGTGSFTTALSTTGVTAGTYRSVTVDTKGRVSSGTNPTTLSGYGITDAATNTHVHGNITNDGKIGSTSGLMIKTTTAGALTALAAGTSGQFLKHDGTWGQVDYSNITNTPAGLVAATSTTLGGILLGSDTQQTATAASIGTTAGRTYLTQVDASGKLVVNVPWTGTVTGVSATVPTGLSVSITNPNTTPAIAISLASGYTIPTTTQLGTYLTASSTLDATKLSGTATVSTTGNADSATKAVAYSAASSTYPTTPANRIFVGSVAPATASVGDIWMW